MTEKKKLVHIEFQQKISKEIGIKVKDKLCVRVKIYQKRRHRNAHFAFYRRAIIQLILHMS